MARLSGVESIPGFDVEGARQAGYSDQEIETHMRRNMGHSPQEAKLSLQPQQQGDIVELGKLAEPLPNNYDPSVDYRTLPQANYERLKPQATQGARLPLMDLGASLLSVWPNPATMAATQGLGLVSNVADFVRKPSVEKFRQLARTATGYSAPQTDEEGLTSAPGPAVGLPRGGGIRGEVTGKKVLALRKAAGEKGIKPSYKVWRDANPGVIGDVLDLSDPQPAMTGRPALPVYEPKFGPSERIVDAFNNPKVIEGLKRGVDQGIAKMKKPWYRTSPLYKEFEAVYGEKAPQEFEDLMNHVAATSPGLKVPNNIRTGSYYWYLKKQGRPVPKEPAPGYGAQYQQLHMENARALRGAGGFLDPIEKPKASRFNENLLGNERELTADTHNFRAIGMLSEDPRFLATSAMKGKTEFNPRKAFHEGKITMAEALDQPTWWDSAPEENEYAHTQAQQQRLAAEYSPVVRERLGRDLMPAEWQDKLWVGHGEMTGLGSPPEPWIESLTARVAYTADILKRPRKEILNLFVRGKIPLLSLGGAAAAGSLGNRSGSKETQ